MANVKEALIKLHVELSKEAEQALSAIRETFQEIEMHFMRPTLGRTVWYRGKQGRQTMRAAVVSCTLEELDQDGVITGDISDLDSEMHVHLRVFTPSVAGAFTEFNVPFGEPGEDGKIPPGTWCWPKIIK